MALSKENIYWLKLYAFGFAISVLVGWASTILHTFLFAHQIYGKFGGPEFGGPIPPVPWLDFAIGFVPCAFLLWWNRPTYYRGDES